MPIENGIGLLQSKLAAKSYIHIVLLYHLPALPYMSASESPSFRDIFFLSVVTLHYYSLIMLFPGHITNLCRCHRVISLFSKLLPF